MLATKKMTDRRHTTDIYGYDRFPSFEGKHVHLKTTEHALSVPPKGKLFLKQTGLTLSSRPLSSFCACFLGWESSGKPPWYMPPQQVPSNVLGRQWQMTLQCAKFSPEMMNSSGLFACIRCSCALHILGNVVCTFRPHVRRVL